jgi:hypothetical protein
MHLKTPAVLFQVHEHGDSIRLEVLKVYDESSEDKIRKLTRRAFDFYMYTHRVPDKINNDGSFDMIPKGVPLKDAYNIMLDERGIYKTLELTTGTIANTKRAIRENDKYPGDETMRVHLQKASWTKTNEEKWTKMKIN